MKSVEENKGVEQSRNVVKRADVSVWAGSGNTFHRGLSWQSVGRKGVQIEASQVATPFPGNDGYGPDSGRRR